MDQINQIGGTSVNRHIARDTGAALSMKLSVETYPNYVILIDVLCNLILDPSLKKDLAQNILHTSEVGSPTQGMLPNGQWKSVWARRSVAAVAGTVAQSKKERMQTTACFTSKDVSKLQVLSRENSNFI